jgi:NADH-quinone oxidoreductase subunit J
MGPLTASLFAKSSDFAEALSWDNLARDPMIWAILLGCISLYALIPRNTKISRAIGVTFGAISVGLFLVQLPIDGGLGDKLVFWLCSTITLVAAVCTISMRSPVYSAIWFAVTLVGVSGLLLFQGAQFLGLATIVVYAGAIVVTFLFVVMLAQPDGYSTYDRITWGHFPRTFAVVAAALLVGILTFAIAQEPHHDRVRVAEAISMINQSGDEPILADDQLASVAVDKIITVGLRSNVSDETLELLKTALPRELNTVKGWEQMQVLVKRRENRDDVLHPAHMAHLGAQLFSRHLLSVELAGTLLLVALVGAISIVIQGRNSSLEESTAS